MKAIAVVMMLVAFSQAKVIATVNGYSITDKEANRVLKVLTKGKVTFDKLRPQDKKALIQRLAIEKLVIKTAYRELSKRERDMIIANAWMAKKARRVKVTEAEMKRAYRKNKNLFRDKKGRIIPYKKVRQLIKIQLKQRKIVNRLMKKAKIVYKF
jgi:hypothetical protein